MGQCVALQQAVSHLNVSSGCELVQQAEDEASAEPLDQQTVAYLDELLRPERIDAEVKQLIQRYGHELVEFKMNRRLSQAGYNPYANFVKACAQVAQGGELSGNMFKFVFHGTPPRNIDSILRVGLRPGKRGGLWFSTSLGTSGFYSGHSAHYKVLLFLTLSAVKGGCWEDVWRLEEPDHSLPVAVLAMRRT